MGTATFGALSLGILAPVIMADLGISRLQLGTVFAVNAVGAAVISPLLGRFTDRFGGRTALITVACVSAASFVLYGIAWSLGVLIIGSLFGAVAQAGAGKSLDDRITPYTGSQLVERWRAFGWEVMEMDGHDIPEILATLEAAKQVEGAPVAVIAHTVKGKGVSYMEGNYEWHSKVPSDEEFALAMQELGESGGDVA